MCSPIPYSKINEKKKKLYIYNILIHTVQCTGHYRGILYQCTCINKMLYSLNTFTFLVRFMYNVIDFPLYYFVISVHAHTTLFVM